MASKNKSVFECTGCGYQTPRWLGRCPECGEWNTFEETTVYTGGSGKAPSRGGESLAKAALLSEIPPDPEVRMDSGNKEVNQVLGGGLMRGASVLVGGEPGIGKSTLMLQLAGNMPGAGKVLYISGEESPGQIKMRAQRLKIDSPELHLLCETRLERLMPVWEELQPSLMVVDSLQTLHSEEVGSQPGSVNQMKFCAQALASWAKENRCALFLVAHVTKGGVIAGPKVVEHMVDTVLHFEQGHQELRILRAAKNRFGSVDEMGLFTMEKDGLQQVTDPSRIFLEERQDGTPPGVAVAPIYEGSRVFLVEIQALTVPAKGGVSRITSDKIDTNRVSRTAAVLEKHLGLQFSSQDIYINVAGGIRLTEVGAELPLAMALYSARTGLSLPPGTAIAGEVSLTGEIRRVPHHETRRKRAESMGFPHFIGPKNARKIQEAVTLVFGDKKSDQGKG